MRWHSRPIENAMASAQRLLVAPSGAIGEEGNDAQESVGVQSLFKRAGRKRIASIDEIKKKRGRHRVFAKQGTTYDKVTSTNGWFTADRKRHATLAFFHPSSLSVESTNPLAEAIGSLGDCSRLIRKQ